MNARRKRRKMRRYFGRMLDKAERLLGPMPLLPWRPLSLLPNPLADYYAQKMLRLGEPPVTLNAPTWADMNTEIRTTLVLRKYAAFEEIARSLSSQDETPAGGKSP